MADGLPLNLHFRTNGAAYVPVFAAYDVPRLAPEFWGNKAAAAAREARFEAVRTGLRDELIAAGSAEDVATLAANSFMAFGFVPNYGLGDDYRSIATLAKMALDAWALATVEAWNASQLMAAE
jgi:hypothetical protein